MRRFFSPESSGKNRLWESSGGQKPRLRLRPDLIQLHAGESLELTAALAADLAPLGIGVIKTVPAAPEARLREFGTADPAACGEKLSRAGVYAALVDARGPENAASAGLHADPVLFRAVRDAARCLTILGGGVKPDNCEEIIRELDPAALDVMSGVERAPGRKSEALLDSLLAAMEH